MRRGSGWTPKPALRERLVGVVRDYTAERGMPPSLREIAPRMGLRSSGYVSLIVRECLVRGELLPAYGYHRGLRVPGQGRICPTCGQPIP